MVDPKELEALDIVIMHPLLIQPSAIISTVSGIGKPSKDYYR